MKHIYYVNTYLYDRTTKSTIGTHTMVGCYSSLKLAIKAIKLELYREPKCEIIKRQWAMVRREPGSYDVMYQIYKVKLNVNDITSNALKAINFNKIEDL